MTRRVDRTQFHRSGQSSLLGKLDAELPKQKISGLTLAKLQAEASTSDMSLAELIRMILDARAFGVDTLKRMHDERIDRVVGKGLEKGAG